MSTSTTRLGLYQYQTTDPADLTANNGNFTTLDNASVARATGQPTINATTAATVTSYTTPAFPGTAFYLVLTNVNIANGTSGNSITLKVTYTEGSSGSAKTEYIRLVASGGSTEVVANGTQSFVNGVYLGNPLGVYALHGTTITVSYQDPTNTPNDSCQATIVQVN